MRYAPGHKQETRRRILDAAATLFRTHGYEGVSVQDIMKAAGLTHGGFYAHFKSKRALFAAVVEMDADFTRRMRAREAATEKGLREGAKEIAAAYLDPIRDAAVARGCSLASLSVDAARGDAKARKAHATRLRELEREFARGLKNAEAPDPRALAAVALAVGGYTLAHACADEALAGAMREACATEIARVLERPRP